MLMQQSKRWEESWPLAMKSGTTGFAGWPIWCCIVRWSSKSLIKTRLKTSIAAMCQAVRWQNLQLGMHTSSWHRVTLWKHARSHYWFLRTGWGFDLLLICLWGRPWRQSRQTSESRVTFVISCSYQRGSDWWRLLWGCSRRTRRGRLLTCGWGVGMCFGLRICSGGWFCQLISRDRST